jgi:hypothetical protein
LAESYFEAGDYGNAVLAAQEVLQRDGSDGSAAAILTLSGLRVSSAALAGMRQRNSISAGTRSEADVLVKNLRDSLADAAPAGRGTKEAVAALPARQRIRAVFVPSAPASAVAAAAGKPMPNKPAAATASASPFDTLK